MMPHDLRRVAPGALICLDYKGEPQMGLVVRYDGERWTLAWDDGSTSVENEFSLSRETMSLVDPVDQWDDDT